MSPHFGLAIDFGFLGSGQRERLEDILALLPLIEHCGFDSVWLGESTATASDGHSPSSLVALAALAPSTKLRLGTAVTVVAGRRARRLALDALVLTGFSAQPPVLGLGLGRRPAWVAFDGAVPDNRGRAFDSRLEEINTTWREVGHPIPEIWIGGSAPGAVLRAARYGRAWCAATGYSAEMIAHCVRQYRDQLDRTAGIGAVAANRVVVLGDTDRSARRTMDRIGGRWRKGYGHPSESPTAAGPPTFTVGTAETVAESIQAHIELGVTHFQIRMWPVDVAATEAAESIESFGRDVIARWRPSTDGQERS